MTMNMTSDGSLVCPRCDSCGGKEQGKSQLTCARLIWSAVHSDKMSKNGQCLMVRSLCLCDEKSRDFTL